MGFEDIYLSLSAENQNKVLVYATWLKEHKG